MTTTSTELNKRRLGTTDLLITSVGLGAWAIGGQWFAGWGAQDDDASIQTIVAAAERGVNWIDTAAIYGHGHSEEIVGLALRRLPVDERPYVFTKCGMVWPDDGDLFSRATRDLRPESIRKELDASLLRLGVDVIDLYQFHRPDAIGTPLSDSWGQMLELKQQGKVRAIGVSNFEDAQLAELEAIGHVDSLQPHLSAVDRTAGQTLIPQAHAAGTGVIVYSPMESGLLTGKFSTQRAAALPDDDWRKSSPAFTEPDLGKNLMLVDALSAIADERKVSVAAVAVAWTLAWPGVSGAIVGARSPRQIDDWIAAGGLELSGSEVNTIAGAIKAADVGQGPVRPS